MKKILLAFGFLLFLGGLLFTILDAPYKYLFQSNAHLNSGKIARAVEFLKEGREKYPNNDQIKFKLAKAYLLLGETELSNKTITSIKSVQSLKKDFDFQNFLVDLSEANYHVGNKKYANYFATCFLTFRDTSKISRKTAKNLLRIGHIIPDKSIELWEEAYNIAHALKESELKEGLRALLLPKYFQIAEGLKTKKKYQEVLSVLNRARALGKSAEVNYQEAKLYTETGKFDLAQKHFEEAIELEPENDDYKISYANALKKIALSTHNKSKRDEYFEKVKLLLVNEDYPRKISILKKIINLNAKYKVENGSLTLTMIGDYLYPYFTFKIAPISDTLLLKYKVVFLDDKQNQIGIYEAPISNDELNQTIEVTGSNPISENSLVNAKLFLNGELVKEYKK